MTGPSTMIGRRFGHWTVLASARPIKRNDRFVCRCDCGTESVLFKSNLYGPKQKRCNDCWVAARRARALAKPHRCERTIDANGRVVCLCACGRKMAQNSPRCWKCSQKLLAEKRRFRPIKFEIAITRIAEDVGVTRQAVSDYIKNHGWKAALEYYRGKKSA